MEKIYICPEICPKNLNPCHELSINYLHLAVSWTTLNFRYLTEILTLLHTCKIISISHNHTNIPPIAQTPNLEVIHDATLSTTSPKSHPNHQ